MKKLASLIEPEQCKENIDDVVKNKKVTLIKKVENCGPFIGVSILFLCVSIILTGIMIYFCLKLKNNVLHY